MAARLALAVATGAASVLPGFLVGALALQIRSDLDVRVEAVAAGVSVFFLAGALSAGWGGRLADHVGAVRAMRWCVLITAACLLAGALLAESLVVLLLLLAVAGVSNAVCQPAINLFVSEQVPADRQGLGFGIKQSGIPAAILVSGLALPLLAIPLGWRATFALCALGPLAIGAGAAPRGLGARLAPPGVAAAVARARPHRDRGGARHGGPERAGRLSRRVGGGRGHRRGHRWPAGRDQQRAEPRGARDARRASGPPA